MPVSPIRKLNSIWVHVRDIKKARQFYHDVLGLNEIWYDEEGESASFRIPRGPPLSMHVQGKGEPGRSAGTVSGIYFSVEDVKRSRTRDRAKGRDRHGPPREETVGELERDDRGPGRERIRPHGLIGCSVSGSRHTLVAANRAPLNPPHQVP